MKLTTLSSVIAIGLLQTACSAGVAVGPGPIGTSTHALSSHEAASIALEWCERNDWSCDVEDVDRSGAVWQVELEAWRASGPGNSRGRGKGLGHLKSKGKGHAKHARYEKTEIELKIDRWTGEVVHVDVDD